MSDHAAKLGFGDFENELASTRKVLERIPEDKFSWQPHAKSMTLGKLALHVATLPWFFEVGVRQNDHDMAGWKQPPVPATRQEIIDKFEANAAEARKALNELKPEMLGEPWSLKMGEQVFFTLPRAAVLRTFALSHIIHHRAQLVVYLRLLDVPIPGLYGPSADEQ